MNHVVVPSGGGALFVVDNVDEVDETVAKGL